MAVKHVARTDKTACDWHIWVDKFIWHVSFIFIYVTHICTTTFSSLSLYLPQLSIVISNTYLLVLAWELEIFFCPPVVLFDWYLSRSELPEYLNNSTNFARRFFLHVLHLVRLLNSWLFITFNTLPQTIKWLRLFHT